VAIGWKEELPPPWGRTSSSSGEGRGIAPAVEDLRCFGELRSTRGDREWEGHRMVVSEKMIWAMEKDRAKSGELI
jgi:hypothetical protein